MKIPPLVQRMLWIAAAPMCVCAQDLTVAVFNYAGVPHAEMAGAIQTAIWAYRAAGIETAWPVCNITANGPDQCTQPLPVHGHYIELALMPRRAKTLDLRLSHGEPAGLALIGGDPLRPRAYAFYEAAKGAADLTVRPIDIVLGCILVHESAHLLGLGHQSNGVMRSFIDAHDLDAAVAGHPFNLDEARRLRTEVSHFRQRALIAERLAVP